MAMNTYTKRFVTDWANEHAQPVALNARHGEAAHLARKLLEAGAREGLDRDDIEEAIDAELEFYMFQAITTAMMQGDARQARTEGPGAVCA
jgi:hypothetical protein